MRKTLLTLAMLAASFHASAQTSLDCAALANSPLAEPEGYAAQCLGNVTPAPQSSGGVLAPTDTAFTVDIRGQAPRLANTLYSFVLNAFPTQTSRGATNPSMFAMDFDPAGTTLFGVIGTAATPPPNALTLGTVNTTTGAYTAIAAITGLTAGDNPTGLTINPTNGAAFLSAVGGTPLRSRLYSLNLTTAAATLIGQMTAPTDPTATIMIDIAMNCAGALFAHNISDDALYSINVTTGAGTFIGTHGLAANFAQGMDFDNQDGTLYAFIYTGGGTNRFGTFNLATGAFTALATDNPLGEYEGAVPTTCGPVVTPPQFNYAPAAGTTVSATGGGAVGSTGTLTITPSIGTPGVGTGAPATTTLTCTAPTAPFAGFGQTVTAVGTGAIGGGPLSGTCTLGAAVATQTLTCNESRGSVANPRTWTLSCPAGTVNPLTSTPISGSTINTPVRVIGGPATTTTVSFTNPNAAPATVTCTAPAATQFTVSPLVINVPASGSASTTISYTSAAIGNFTGTLTCTSGAQTFNYTLNGSTVGQVQAVDANSTWSLIAMVLALLGFGAVMVRRRA